MPRVPRPARTCAAIAATLALLALGVLPAAHVHVPRAPDTHHAVVAHRHFEAHHQAQVAVVADDDHDSPQWLKSALVNTARTTGASPAAAPVCYAHAALQPPTTSRAKSQVLFVSVHDPPWAAPSGLRAPPASRL